jgi:hypothetical protein
MAAILPPTVLVLLAAAGQVTGAAAEAAPSCVAAGVTVVLDDGARWRRQCDDGQVSVGDEIALDIAGGVRLVADGRERVCTQLGHGEPRVWSLTAASKAAPLTSRDARCAPTDDGGVRCAADDGTMVLACSRAVPARARTRPAPTPAAANASEEAPDDLARATLNADPGGADLEQAPAPITTEPSADEDRYDASAASDMPPSGDDRPSPAAADEDGDEGPDEADPRPSVFLNRLLTRDVSPAAGRVVTDLVAARLAAYPRLKVVSGAEVARLLALQAERASFGCDDDDPGCVAELAGALGARYLVAGDLTKLDRAVFLSLVLLDTRDSRVVGRARIAARTVEQLHEQLPLAVNNLLAELLTLTVQPVPDPPLGRLVSDFQTLAAAAAIGAATSVAAAVAVGALGAAGVGVIRWYEGTNLSTQGDVTQFFALVFSGFAMALIAPVLAGVAAPVVGLVGAALADWLADAEVSAARLALMATVGIACAGLTLIASVPLTIVGGIALLVRPGGTADFSELAAIMAGSAVVAALTSGVAMGTTYALGVGWFGDRPAE